MTAPQKLDRLELTARALSSENPFMKGFDLEMVDATIELAARRYLTDLRARIDKIARVTAHVDVLHGFRTHIRSLQKILEWVGVKEVSANPPRLTDYVGAAVIERALRRPSWPSPRTPDEKFGILSAPNQYSDDFRWVAENAHGRRRSFALAFIDIDDFKKVNKRYTESSVDREVLPEFMKKLESFCFGRALAYRQGGDEYLVLLINTTEVAAERFFDELRAELESLTYAGCAKGEKITVSVGVHVITERKPVTQTEALMIANRAKERAKELGKNRVEMSTDDDAEQVDLVIVGEQYSTTKS